MNDDLFHKGGPELELSEGINGAVRNIAHRVVALEEANVRLERLIMSLRQSPGRTPANGGGYVAKARPVDGPTCPECSGTKWWNNVEKKRSGKYSAKAPDLSCANREKCDGRIWDLLDHADPTDLTDAEEAF